MSLTSPLGRAPFQPGRRQTNVPLPDRISYWEPWPRRMRANIAGVTVLDTERAVMLWQTDRFPDLYLPGPDVTRPDLIDDRFVHPAPVPDLHGYVSVDFEAADRWFEEDDPVYGHVRDPYHRIDVRSSSRSVVVRAGGRVVAASARPKVLYETGNPTRYYLPFVDVDIGALSISETVSHCPYKGDGQHWTLHVEDILILDAAWSLPHPLPEAVQASEHLCFYPTKVDLVVDDQPAQE
ncbi:MULTISPECIES: DUF427 domain-containing protein [unclassified Nocardioides]|uniref:DUF427 domain-containing protein n=1 Tax=unclassified Nocardioides TaxID=2615069 RepID=UPI0009F11E6E|nr:MULTISPECIES: DUF427 domain-containing protein [unclassified Nocardioides]GAW48004.1 uncharacterized protein PD653B2_0315 [Nocardioides sp. PD653-B2]GAW53693.1 uncharacterized protein PD653_1096 [Nocardioides sp. PD653]